jgi:trans-aconitate methyltransferase
MIASADARKTYITLKTVIDRINKMKDNGELPGLEVSNPMSDKKDKLLFNISIIEQYRDKHKMDGDKVISLFKANSIFDYLNEHYDTLHTMSIESVVNDVEEILNRGQQ